MVALFSKFSVSFTAKFELVLVLTQENAFSKRFYFKTNRKSKGSSKKTVLGIIFKLTIRLRDQHVFMRQWQKILNVSNTFETNFLKIKNHFQKAGVMFFS